MPETNPAQSEFATESQAKRTGFAKELLHFLAHNKKWWLLPIVVVLVLLAALAILAGTAVAPFIYTLF
ncbi:MAG: hypothetical protein QOI04_2396 [Verrucomicrobiota bacterium]|jgi:hypothetical protein